MSEFGKGFTYCLGLFLCHADKRHGDKKIYDSIACTRGPTMWFDGAGDHLYEFDTEKAPEPLKEKCNTLKEKALHWRLSEATWEDVEWAIQEAKDILREYDALQGFEVEKGDWE
jgi:hypothetical protein